MSRQRGRPKLYDAETALQAAGSVFWSQGYNGTSLDDLSAAMAMNRPSIYRAFGDKKAIYRRALAQFGAHMEEGFKRTILSETDFRKGLRRFYREALDVYYSGETAKGCMVMCTAPAAAMNHPEVKSDLLAVLQHLDVQIIKRIEQAIEQEQLCANQDAGTLGKLIQAVLHTLAIRARAGEPKASLQQFADSAVLMLVGSE
jgi:TetR/AcrR family transcriptional regulator, copper-responsive repressor